MPNPLAILVVEDELDLRDILLELLPYYHLSADSATSAEQALDLLAQNRYAGAIIDLGLPGMNGLELVKLIRSQPTTRDLPCVALTAWHSSVMRRDALAAGFTAYFAKLFDPDIIFVELKAAIGLS
jgi:CheY-like chemotaxis protein